MKLPHNLTQQLTHTLGLAIINGKYPVGQGMPSEAEICEEFEVSRSSTREAVKMLSAKGLISSRPKQGIRVLPENNWNMFDTDILSWILKSKPSLILLKEFLQVRLAMEPVAAELAAKNATPTHLQNIEKALGRMSDAKDGLDDALDSEIAFHCAILEASGNRFFIQLKDFINTALRVSTRYQNYIYEDQHDFVNTHELIFKSIKSGNAQAAKESTNIFLETILQRVESKL
ncbi:FadR/GntR family transcriptional regulator [Agaribacter flavus]|uniref:FadR/GntR family transcriptional regulator n=1 Tax=Agaribacter flavus TaxID=1902781 RepID=A0ABV7FQY6_9ALTE